MQNLSTPSSIPSAVTTGSTLSVKVLAWMHARVTRALRRKKGSRAHISERRMGGWKLKVGGISLKLLTFLSNWS